VFTQWEKKLRAMGMERREDLGRLNTAEFWGDGTRYPISVPADENGEVEFWAFQRICRQIDSDGVWSNWTGDDC
jgi:hypothetical protein